MPRDGQTGRPAWPGPGEARPVLGLARQARIENRVRPSKHTGSIFCSSPTRLARKKRAEKRAMRIGKHVLV
jgi:hypothetical protein